MPRKSQGPSVSFFAFQDIITAVVGIFVLITLIMIIELVSKAETTSSRIETNVESLKQLSSSLEKNREKLSQQLRELTLAAEDSRGANGLHPEFQERELQKQLTALNEQKQDLSESVEDLEHQLSISQALNQTLSRQWDVSRAEVKRVDDLQSKIDELENRLQRIQSEDPMVFRAEKLQGRTIVIFDLHPDRVEIASLEAGRRETFKGTNSVAAVQNWIRSQNLNQIHILVFVRPKTEKLFSEIQDTLKGHSASFGFDVLGANKKIVTDQDLSREQ